MKEVIFHFSPSVRFLGLGLKILFHKNKEIERMLSKKMTFSLMSLITLLAFAFMAPSVMAAEEIGAVLIMTADIGHADGLQIEHPGATPNTPATTIGDVGELEFIIRFAKPVDLLDASLSISIFDEDDAFLSTPAARAAAAITAGTDPTAGQFSVTQPQLEDGFTGDVDLRDWTVTIPGLDADARKVKVRVAKAVVTSDAFNDETTAQTDLTIGILGANDPNADPDVYKIALVGEAFSIIKTATFQVHVLLSEEPKGGFVADSLEVAEATVDSVVQLTSPGASVSLVADIDRDDTVTPAGEDAAATWRDQELYLYLVTLKTAAAGAKTVTIKVKDFASMEKPAVDANNVIGNQQMYIRRADDGLEEDRDILTVKTEVAAPVVALTGGTGFFIAHGEGTTIPAGGYLVLTKNKDGSGVAYSHEKDNENIAAKQTPAQLLFNTRAAGLPNLDNIFTNGGTVYLTTSDTAAAGSVVISEVMWGSDSAQADSANSQWIELHNTTATAITIAEKKWALVFFNANETLPGAADTFTVGADAAGTAVDSVGTRDEASGTFWSIAGKGQSGRSDVNPAVADTAPIIGDTVPIISMQRASTAGVYASGTAASSWSQSVIPALNFKTGIEGSRVGTPGAAPVTLTAPPVVEDVPEAAPAASVAEAGDIVISEIMVDTGNGRLPQWIELHNVSASDASLKGWDIAIEDAQGSIVYSLGSVTVDAGQTALVVSETTNRNSGIGTDEGDLRADRIVNLDVDGTLIDAAGFKISLIVPAGATGGRPSADIAGNLGGDWDVPASEGDRSSLIRKYDAGVAGDGTMAASWVLAADTGLLGGHNTYYGDSDDEGTPGYRSGGPLPVELSHFRPARDEAGAVVITWLTQSELNNAGFFIKRSQQRDGQFKVINAAMIQGAGTTSEKQFYTYTDTTAQPNVVYYYQIEDVSLDGNRQTLTNGTRLKGHIGAAGKLTTLWGDLKTSQ